MSTTGRPQGPPCHHSILGACRCGASAGASGRACNYTTGLGCGQCHALAHPCRSRWPSPAPLRRLPSLRRPFAKCAKAVPAPALAGSTANFPRSQNPAIISEIASSPLQGMSSLAWLVGATSRGCPPSPLAHAAASIDTWWTLGETLAYGKLEIQGRVRDGLVVDPAVKWIVVRMLTRGRYVRYCDVRRAGDWDLLKASLRRTCQLPSWWSPPWAGHAADVAASRNRGPLLPKEWEHSRSSKRVRRTTPGRTTGTAGSACSRPRSRSPCTATLKNFWAHPLATLQPPGTVRAALPEVGAAPASDNPRRAEEATGQSLDNGSMDSPLPSQQAQAKRRRRPKAKTDLKGGASYQSASSSSGSTPSLFRVISANVTSLFSRDAAVCAIGFGVAFLAETALTARGQEILTVSTSDGGPLCCVGCSR